MERDASEHVGHTEEDKNTQSAKKNVPSRSRAMALLISWNSYWTSGSFSSPSAW